MTFDFKIHFLASKKLQNVKFDDLDDCFSYKLIQWFEI